MRIPYSAICTTETQHVKQAAQMHPIHHQILPPECLTPILLLLLCAHRITALVHYLDISNSGVVIDARERTEAIEASEIHFTSSQLHLNCSCLIPSCCCCC